jgi:hypothetical protein
MIRIATRLSMSAICLVAFGAAHGAKLSELVVLKGAKSGQWSFTSNIENGVAVTKPTQTSCLTKAQIMKNFSHSLYENTKTGVESCPTILTTNKPELGVATLNCPAMEAAGSKIPAFMLSYSIKKESDDTWIISAGTQAMKETFKSTVTYMGASTTGCTARK